MSKAFCKKKKKGQQKKNPDEHIIPHRFDIYQLRYKDLL